MTARPPVDYGYLAQQAAETRLAECERALWCSQGDCELPEHAGEDDVWCVSPASGPYCGCTTCQVRETLDAAWPILLESAREPGAAGG